MGYLLKEALKTLCGVNQWSYAVFWKIGCQNPELLIWEECYYEPVVSSNHSKVSGLGSIEMSSNEWESAGRIQLLVDQMMIKNQINIVGEGIVGRAAFMGSHLWALSKSFNGDDHPPEVLVEMRRQFSAGIQTVVVIPVSPLGVVQLGSSFSINENIEFVNNVRSLILQLGCIPNALFSEIYAAKIGSPASLGMTCNIPIENCKSTIPMASDQISRTSALAGNLPNALNRGFSDHFQSKKSHPNPDLVMKTIPPLQEKSGSSFFGYNQTPSDPDGWCNSSIPVEKQSVSGIINQNFLVRSGPQEITREGISHELIRHSHSTSGGSLMSSLPPCYPVLNVPNHPEKDFQSSSNLGGVPLFTMKNHVLSTGSSCHSAVEFPRDESACILIRESPSQWVQSEKQDACSQSTATNFKHKDASLQQHLSGDDLFDVLGVDLKSKILGSDFHQPGVIAKEIPISLDMQEDSSDIYASLEGLCDDGIFSEIGMDDHLLDAVVSKARSVSKQSSDDTISCKTALTKISSSSVPSKTPTFHGNNMPCDHIEREMIRSPKLVESIAKPVSPPNWRGDKEGTCSQATSFYGSQISTWVEQSHAVKVENSVSTGYSKRPNEDNKLNRKRLKPGENPRPRPKDRQMIQDRVKELREIVPNGAKCSIDALLERTIKHMLFLQSVTKHAEKLKESGESKIINHEGGPLLKDSSAGGATWAFEVGSKSMVCPIIVEDLSAPRQMLVEMLCEDQGLFLEIADMIRGLGLTILKGAMEARNNKIWSRFTVEANRDVTRIEIFMSLVHLLDQNLKVSNTNPMAPLHYFSQPASIPTSCGPQ
ncbi:hypothetical protein SAY86_002560 [Trapa natans]|uniref:BHLH domain-containing protein n=1 Tax=Trapa natans TaxID=22666 RepID=A0AAN7LTL3_TRANT|nr:hypothetical protein SAY86_002560 [Trapa natans]